MHNSKSLKNLQKYFSSASSPLEIDHFRFFPLRSPSCHSWYRLRLPRTPHVTHTPRTPHVTHTPHANSYFRAPHVTHIPHVTHKPQVTHTPHIIHIPQVTHTPRTIHVNLLMLFILPIHLMLLILIPFVQTLLQEGLRIRHRIRSCMQPLSFGISVPDNGGSLPSLLNLSWLF